MTKLQTWLGIGVIILLLLSLGFSGYLLYQNNKFLKNKKNTTVYINSNPVELDSFYNILHKLEYQLQNIDYRQDQYNRRLKSLTKIINTQNEIFNSTTVNTNDLDSELSDILDNN